MYLHLAMRRKAVDKLSKISTLPFKKKKKKKKTLLLKVDRQIGVMHDSSKPAVNQKDDLCVCVCHEAWEAGRKHTGGCGEKPTLTLHTAGKTSIYLAAAAWITQRQYKLTLK